MPRAIVGLLSPGDMGVGIAKLLIANDYRVITNVSGRSKATQDRAAKASIKLVNTDEELCSSADYILSIVPPRDALKTAQRIVDASAHASFSARKTPLYFLDLNAISPRSAREINQLFAEHAPTTIRHIDGGIIGGPPKLEGNTAISQLSIPLSGPYRLDDHDENENDTASHPPSGAHFAQTLNTKHINATIGSATGLKMCFASLTKGFTALAIQSYTAAHALGVTDELRDALAEFNPSGRARAESSVATMAPKAYRFVAEMEEIADTFEVDGGFAAAESPFRGIAQIYDFVANGTVLGEETTEHRVRGKTAEDAARWVAEATAQRRRKDGEEEV